MALKPEDQQTLDAYSADVEYTRVKIEHTEAETALIVARTKVAEGVNGVLACLLITYAAAVLAATVWGVVAVVS